MIVGVWRLGVAPPQANTNTNSTNNTTNTNTDNTNNTTNTNTDNTSNSWA